MSEVRWGAIGAGRIARSFASDVRLAPNARLVAIAARSMPSARAFADEYELPKAYASYDGLFADPDIDAVYIATPHNLHANQARGASRRPAELPLERAERQGAAASQVDSVATRQVLAAFERLAADQRQVLLLVAVEGLAYREVAEVLGIPLGTVMSRLARGREQLRRLVDDGAGAADRSLRRVK